MAQKLKGSREGFESGQGRKKRVIKTIGKRRKHMENNFTTSDFEERVLKSEIPVLVDFYADWCGPCKMMAPVVEALAGEMEGSVKVGKLNIDENESLAVKYGVMTIPTLAVFKKGELVDKLIGVQPKDKLQTMIEKNL